MWEDMGFATSGQLMPIFPGIVTHHVNSPRLTPVSEDVSFSSFVDLMRRAQRS